jgi:general L-amino acid transport system permease protein
MATTIAKGGIHPDGWSGACWAFIGIKIRRFLLGRYLVAKDKGI